MQRYVCWNVAQEKNLLARKMRIGIHGCTDLPAIVLVKGTISQAKYTNRRQVKNGLPETPSVESPKFFGRWIYL